MRKITEMVQNILDKVGVNIPPIPVEKVANAFSIKVIPYPKFPDNVSGTIVNYKESIIIGVNSNHPYVRKRFTIAHELGHFFNNHDIIEKIIDDVFDKTSDKEIEANKFAAELLMPLHLLKNDINKNLDIPGLARRYEVSEQAMSIRLLETKLIDKM